MRGRSGPGRSCWGRFAGGARGLEGFSGLTKFGCGKKAARREEEEGRGRRSAAGRRRRQRGGGRAFGRAEERCAGLAGRRRATARAQLCALPPGARGVPRRARPKLPSRPAPRPPEDAPGPRGNFVRAAPPPRLVPARARGGPSPPSASRSPPSPSKWRWKGTFKPRSALHPRRARPRSARRGARPARGSGRRRSPSSGPSASGSRLPVGLGGWVWGERGGRRGRAAGSPAAPPPALRGLRCRGAGHCVRAAPAAAAPHLRRLRARRRSGERHAAFVSRGVGLRCPPLLHLKS